MSGNGGNVTVDDLAELQTLMLAQQERLDAQQQRVDELVEGLRLSALSLLGMIERVRPEGGSGGL